MRIRFIFHKGKDSLVGRGIIAWTGFLALFYNWRLFKYPFSHEEVWIPNNVGKFDTTGMPITDSFYGLCFSSTTRGDWNGVRFAPANEVVGKHPDRWDYIEVDVDEEHLEVALAEGKRLVGAKYDFAGIFGFIQPILIQDDKKWYCSEICDWFKSLCRIPTEVAFRIRIPVRHNRISPRRAAYLLAKMYGEPKPVKD